MGWAYMGMFPHGSHTWMVVSNAPRANMGTFSPMPATAAVHKRFSFEVYCPLAGRCDVCCFVPSAPPSSVRATVPLQPRFTLFLWNRGLQRTARPPAQGSRHRYGACGGFASVGRPAPRRRRAPGGGEGARGLRGGADAGGVCAALRAPSGPVSALRAAGSGAGSRRGAFRQGAVVALEAMVVRHTSRVRTLARRFGKLLAGAAPSYVRAVLGLLEERERRVPRETLLAAARCDWTSDAGRAIAWRLRCEWVGRASAGTVLFP